jgi:anthranilate phosphoribosyltransferase
MIEEAIIFHLLDLAFDAVSVGLEKDVVIAQVKAMEEKGATPAEIAAALKKMRDDAIATAQAAIDKASGG